MPIVKIAIRTPNPGQGIRVPWHTPLRPQAVGWTPPHPHPGRTPYRASVSSLPRIHFPQRQILLENSFLRDLSQQELRGDVGLGGVLFTDRNEMWEETRPALPVRCKSMNVKLKVTRAALTMRERSWRQNRQTEAQANQVSWRAPVHCTWGPMRNVPGYWG